VKIVSATDTTADRASRPRQVPAGDANHQVQRVAAGIREVARRYGVELDIGYSEVVAADGLSRCEQIGVSRLGEGVVIHTAPDSKRQLPILLGYAEAGRAWLRSGRSWPTETAEVAS
jgi:hypothetical protein